MLYFVDVSDTTDDAAGSSFKVKAQRFASTDGSAVAFTGGGTIALAGFTLTAEATGTVVDKATAQTLTSKTLTTPTIASMVNATHDHADAAGGGDLASPTITSASLTTPTAADGSSGATSETYARALIVESSDADNGGISILSKNTAKGLILFGDPEDASAAFIEFDHADNGMSIGVTGTTLQIEADEYSFATGVKIILPPALTKASGATGTTGEIAWDASYFYVCTSTNTWERVALTGGY